MTTIHDDPEDFADDQLAGWLALYADRVRGVHGGVVALPTEGADPQVAVVVGGGSGHYPAFCGVVGPASPPVPSSATSSRHPRRRRSTRSPRPPTRAAASCCPSATTRATR